MKCESVALHATFRSIASTFENNNGTHFEASKSRREQLRNEYERMHDPPRA